MPGWNDPSRTDDPTWVADQQWRRGPGWDPGPRPSNPEQVSSSQSTSRSPSPRPGGRRALLGSIAGVVMLAGPIAVASALVPDDGANVEVSNQRDTSFLAAVRQDTQEAKQVNRARMNDALALQPTTTVAKEPVPTTTTAPTVVHSTTVESRPSTSGSDDSVWDALAQCESGGNWHINTGNGYYGGLQFTLSTWQSVGGTGYPHEHSRETQIEMGKRLQARAGWGQWPSCARKLGLI